MSASQLEPEPPWRWIVSDDEHEGRLDAHVAQRTKTPRNRVQLWIRAGNVRVASGAKARPSLRVQAGQEITVAPPPRSDDAESLLGEPGELQVLHEDEHLLFVDKPAGLVVHPGAGNQTGTLCQRLLWHYPEVSSVGHPRRPGIVHRLDAGTTGVMVVARSQRAYDSLSRDFSERRVGKRYMAIVHGLPKEVAATIDLPIGRHRQDRKRMTVEPDGRPSQTQYRVIQSGYRVSVLGIRLLTGRTHQIRVHLKEVRHPLLGDPVYGEDRWKELAGKAKGVAKSFSRPALHAWRLTVAHPISGAKVDVQALPAEDLRKLWDDLAAEALLTEPPRDL